MAVRIGSAVAGPRKNLGPLDFDARRLSFFFMVLRKILSSDNRGSVFRTTMVIRNEMDDGCARYVTAQAH